MKPFFQTWIFQVFAPYLYTYIKYKATGQWDQIKGQTKQNIVSDPNKWHSLLTMEIVLATVVIMVIDLCLTSTAVLARVNGEGATTPIWIIAENITNGVYFVVLTWYCWLVIKNVILMLLQYILSSYERDKSIIRQRFSFVSGLMAAIAIALVFQTTLSNVVYDPEIGGEEIEITVLAIKIVTGLTLVILSTSVFNQYGLGLSSDRK